MNQAGNRKRAMILAIASGVGRKGGTVSPKFLSDVLCCNAGVVHGYLRELVAQKWFEKTGVGRYKIVARGEIADIQEFDKWLNEGVKECQKWHNKTQKSARRLRALQLDGIDPKGLNHE